MIRNVSLVNGQTDRLALLYRRGIGGQDFLQQTPQLDRPDICWRDVPNSCVTAAKIHIGLEIEGRESPLTGG
jgi:hypothetical protein